VQTVMMNCDMTVQGVQSFAYRRKSADLRAKILDTWSVIYLTAIGLSPGDDGYYACT